MASLFWIDLPFEWYEDVMVFRVFIFIFLFKANGKKGHLDENYARHCYSNLKVPFWNFLDNDGSQWEEHFERHPTVENFAGMDQHKY